MKIKTSELIGPALDWAVGQCAYDTKVIAEDGVVYFTSADGYRTGRCNPSTNWAQGGPIIEREEISIGKADEPEWWAFKGWKAENGTPGPTPLVAAMRCYVASKLGDEVEIPDELITKE
jgi:hypothetical protein